MKNIFCEARDVQIGDNIWGHQIVKIVDVIIDDKGDELVVFNGGTPGAWKIPAKEKVMVSNRLPKK